MIDSICVIGHPSYFGGADTELFDQIKIWIQMKIKVYIMNTGIMTPTMSSMNLEKMGCIYLPSRQWQHCENKHCISFCNGEFLKNVHLIRRHAKTITFVNCMTWNFEKEIEAQKNGYIDLHLYQTNHAFHKVSQKLREYPNYRAMQFTPYFDTSRFPYHRTRFEDKFRFGRISRDDPSKYNLKQLDIFDRFESSKPKSGLIVGWSKRVEKKLNISPSDISVLTKNNSTYEMYKNYLQLLKPGGCSQTQFYQFADVVVMHTDTFENLPRVGFESMCSGSVLVCDRRGGWELQIDDGETGFLCDSSDHFIDRMTVLANDTSMRDRFRTNAKKKMESEWGIDKSINTWRNVFDCLETIK